MKTDFVKVLIIGETFRKNGGGGITLINLFKNWPIDKIAVIATPDKILQSETSYCKSFYQLGYKETKARLPFNFFQQKYSSGKVNFLNGKVYNHNTQKIASRIRIVLKKLFKNNFLGYYYKRFQLSNELYSWINDFNPDIIYAQFVHYETINIVNHLYYKMKIPYCLHILDDLPLIMGNEDPLIKLFFRTKIKRNIQILINNATTLMSIGDKMSKEYLSRYNKKFYPFHNPVEIKNWLPFTKSSYSIQQEVKIIFAGRISKYNNVSINKLISIILKANSIGNKIYLDIFSPVKEQNLKIDNNFINHYPFVSYDQLPKLISSYDIVFLPLNFDKNTINFAKFSMPTKISEYMISGVPILIFAPEETALYQYANEFNFATVCKDEERLERSLVELVNNESKREQLAHVAINLAKVNHDANSIRRKFKRVLYQTSSREVI